MEFICSAKELLDPPNLDLAATVPPAFYPVLYQVGLNDAQGIFLAQSIQIRDKDVVLITNAEATQLQKLLAVVRGFTGVAYDLKKNTANP